jgi:hypothetical protein
MNETYWIEIINATENENIWYWQVKCINGRVKASGHYYSRKVYCINDAKSFAEYTGLEIR